MNRKHRLTTFIAILFVNLVISNPAMKQSTCCLESCKSQTFCPVETFVKFADLDFNCNASTTSNMTLLFIRTAYSDVPIDDSLDLTGLAAPSLQTLIFANFKGFELKSNALQSIFSQNNQSVKQKFRATAFIFFYAGEPVVAGYSVDPQFRPTIFSPPSSFDLELYFLGENRMPEVPCAAFRDARISLLVFYHLANTLVSRNSLVFDSAFKLNNFSLETAGIFIWMWRCYIS